tara:strand:- start:1144 stop:2931 length:1788 start_codon:yes stop_codon:yes gene_type:complete
MIRTILARVLILGSLASAVFADGHDTMMVAWDGTPGYLESTIMGDTTSDGSQAHDVYMLESNKVYLQLSEINLYTSCAIVGAPYGDGEHPATIQPIGGSDGASQFTGWPQNNFKTYGMHQTYQFKNLLMNGVYADEIDALFGVLATYGESNVIIVDHVTSVHNSVITYFNFGRAERWHLTNNKAVQYTSYPGGMYFGGFFWGGGGWGGTLIELLVQNNTIEGAHGEGMVLWDNTIINGYNDARIDHNTFVNIINWPKFYRGGNNSMWTNNLFVNMVSGPQTHNFHGQGPSLNLPGGLGYMATPSQSECTDSLLLALGRCWDNNNREIHYENNAWVATDEMLDLFNMEPWCWDVTDTNDVTTTFCDTMIGGPSSTYDYNQARWMDDSTEAQMVNGISESNNLHATDLGFNLDPVYINTQIARTMDWLDNKVHDTHTDKWWNHQADGNKIVVEWPLPMDFSYSTASAAYTHGHNGSPVGDLNHFPDAYATWEALSTDNDNQKITPDKFALSQNYPNPFNPTTEISFTMDQASSVSLTVFNMLGQKVRVLENASLEAGTHSYNWDGRDDLGQSVSTGVYLYTLSDGSKSITKKMALMK